MQQCLYDKKKIVISIQFNTYPYDENRLSKEWIQKRLFIFEKYTLKSLKAQSCQKFECYVIYDKQCEVVIQECIDTHPPMPTYIHFVDPVKYEQALKQCILGYEQLYLVRLDSDNLYRKDYIECLYRYQPKAQTEVLLSQEGYVYEECTHILARYKQISPPFYAFIYRVEDYLNGKRYSSKGGHRKIIINYRVEVVEGAHYMITLHEQNVSNTNRLIQASKIIQGESKQLIMNAFGLK